MGKIINNGIVYGGGSSVELDATLSIEGKAADAQAVGKVLGIELTQAEYNALSESERNNGTYWVTDGEGGEGDGSGIYIETTDVIDNLTSTATNLPLSAKQGKVLNEKTLHIVSFDATTGTLVTKSWDYEG